MYDATGIHNRVVESALSTLPVVLGGLLAEWLRHWTRMSEISDLMVDDKKRLPS